MARKRRTVKPPQVTYTLLTRDSHREAYVRLDRLVADHHEELEPAKIALAWCTSWRADTDGKVTLGRMMRASQLSRELAEWDAVVLLSQQFWTAPETTEIQRDALLDHELHHLTTKLDAYGDPVKDARGRIVYRTRRHDIEEFAAIPARYGLYKRDLEDFVSLLLKQKEQPKLPIGDSQQADAGPVVVTNRSMRVVQ